jgi:hypothetical protein
MAKPHATFNKGIRFTDEELALADALLKQFPEFRSQADVLHQAALIGLLVLATQAIRPGLPAYAGYRPSDLAALLKYRLMSAIDFLIEHNAVPAALSRPVSSPDAPQAQEVADDRDTTVIVADAAEGLDDLGSGFMDD